MHINGKVTNPGEMHTLVTLQTRSVTNNTGGFQQPAWVSLADVWAKWTNVHGAEAWAASAIEAKAPTTVLIRYRSDVDTTCAVLKGSQLYEITSIDDILELHEFLELKVHIMRSG